MNEIEWKPIPGYEKYMISTNGDIKSDKGFVNHHIEIYRRVALDSPSIPGKKNTQLVHRLVALTFLERPDGARSVIFKNKDGCDCRVSNLQWRLPGRTLRCKK